MPLIFITSNIFAQSTEKENAVKAYYSGFERKEWADVANQLAEDFTFTSPNNDDHISLKKFKDKCWATAKFIKKVNYIKMMEKGDDLMLQVQIITVDNKVIRNVDVFSFNNTGKIRSIEVFFGSGSKYPGNTE